MERNRLGERSDDQLMVSVAGGDRAAFHELVQRHHRTAWAVALRFAGHPDDAEDLVQDAFLAVFKKAGSYRPQGRFRSYLLCILANGAISGRRKQRPVLAESPPEPAGGPEGESSLAQAQASARIAALLSALPERQRMAIVLCYYEDLSHAEIGLAMSISPKAVERLLHRARTTLRAQLDSPSPG